MTHLVHETITQSGNDWVLVAIDEFSDGRSSATGIRISQVKPLSFGAPGTLFGLKIGMPKDQVISIIRAQFGDGTTLEKSQNGENWNLPESLAAYDIISKRDTQGTSARGFVVFDENEKLREIFFNSDQLEEVSSCKEYSPTSFAQFFMAHFNLREMDVEKKTSASDGRYYEIAYKHSGEDFNHSFMWHPNDYSIYIIHKTSKVKF